MTTTQDRDVRLPAEPGPAPRRGPGGRLLTALGVTVGVLLVAWGGLQLADWASATTARASHTYAAAPVVEVVADGHVTVQGVAGQADTGADPITVDRTDRSGLFSGPSYATDVEGQRLVVSDRCGWWPVSGVCQGSLDVAVPERTQVVVRGSNGVVRASGLVGDADLRTSNGRVEVSDVDGSLDAATSNGSIDVSDVTGDAVLETSNGRVDVDRVSGDVDAESSNGDITVRGIDGPVALTMETSNGQRTVQGATDPSAPIHVRMKTSNGDVSYLG